MDLFAGVKKLILQERATHAREIAKLDRVLAALNDNGDRRVLSASARRRIGAAQRARWAATRNGQDNAKPKRTMGAAARRKIAAAQRARWAKLRNEK